MNSDEVLRGGVANAGSVIKRQDKVIRPSNKYSRSIHRYLKMLREAGFDGVSMPDGFEDDGRERLFFIEGDVGVPPYPEWVQTDSSLMSVVKLMRKFHSAATKIQLRDLPWSDELADPEGGPIICHNDVCLENVVFRDNQAVALIDFDFAAPGRPIYDLAQLARMCVPMDSDTNSALLGWKEVDKFSRLRLVADVYKLTAEERPRLLAMISEQMVGISSFVQRRLDAGDANFTRMWENIGGAKRFTRRREWFEKNRRQFELAMS